MEKAVEQDGRNTAVSANDLAFDPVETIDLSGVKDIREISGEGVIATVDGKEIACGNPFLMARVGCKWHDCHQIGTIVHVSIDGDYAGHILIADVVKPTAKEAVGALKAAGVRNVVMLSGDRKAVAEETANELGIDTVRSQLLPDEKVKAVEELLAAQPKAEKTAFVGDGINDAPVLSRADIGIAMGALGADAAIEAADVVLMDDDPVKTAKAIRIAKKVMRIVYENIWFAFGVKVICLILGAFGIASMWLAIFADVGVMVIAVVNAIRALFVKNV